ncbi:hypothetical protein HGRIS_002564 [Hohenbuehelia grisea]|uniref:Uncharacterized protein n=1 Tax=Hohenbuehelia grisea TaxID=104357 RepID=A0ABR3JL03_9AGAR
MSGSSYRLEAPRPRVPPAPLSFKESSYNSSASTFAGNQDSQILLYDHPSASSMPSPPSSRRQSRLISPTSPTFPGGRSRTPGSGRPTPPPSARNRSATPHGFSQNEIEMFAGQCRAWYFNQDEDAGRLMTQTLTDLPPSSKAPFSRLQASIRSEYHRSVNARKTAEFRAHLSGTVPGGSLLPAARVDPHSSLAQKERLERFEQFITNWCTVGMPGTQPFFEGLWAVMRLQVLPEHLGGAGPHRIEWEIDDAVFRESAGKEFMLEAVDILKGVLGFEEVSSSRCLTPSLSHEANLLPSITHLRSQSQPLKSHESGSSSAAPTIQPKRARAPSDPFLDTPALSHSIPSLSSQSSGNTAGLVSALSSEGMREPPSPSFAELRPSPWCADLTNNDAEEDPIRIWTSPDLYNPEYLPLLKVFPSFVTRKTLPRFPGGRLPDIEEGDEEVRAATGTLRISPRMRSDGWKGGWWTRFVLWLRRIFC